MNKRYLHHLLLQIRKVKLLYFAVLLVAAASMSVIGLRQNNLRAIELRDRVSVVDKQDGDVEAALRELREFTYSHMNSGLASDSGVYPPIQLKYRYERLVQAEKDRVSKANGVLYTKAQKHCEAQIPVGRSLNRIECIQNYITSNGGVSEKEIPDSLYKFDFAPPVWSSDLAGWSILATILLAVLLLLRIVATSLIRLVLK